MAKKFKGIRPMRGKAILTPVQITAEETTDSGIVLYKRSPEEIRNLERANELATVIAIGAPGEFGPAEFKKGDTVVAAKDLANKKHTATDQNGLEFPLWIISFGHVSGVMEEDVMDTTPEEPVLPDHNS